MIPLHILLPDPLSVNTKIVLNFSVLQVTLGIICLCIESLMLFQAVFLEEECLFDF